MLRTFVFPWFLLSQYLIKRHEAIQVVQVFVTGSTRASSRLPHPRYSTASSGPFAPRVSACGRQGSRAFLAVSWLQRPLLPL